MFHMMHMSSIPRLAHSNWLMNDRTLVTYWKDFRLIWSDFLCVFYASILRIFFFLNSSTIRVGETAVSVVS